MSHAPPPAEGVRPTWSTLPDAVRSELEGWLGSAVQTAESQAGGFSPGIASRIRTVDGTRYFVKAVGPRPNRDSPGMHRREAQIVAAIPDGVDVPRLLWSYEDEETGWVLLVLQDVEGTHPEMPWRSDELEQGDRRPRETSGRPHAIAASGLAGRKRETCVPAGHKRLAATRRRPAVRS